MPTEPAMKIEPVRNIPAKIILNISTMQEFKDSVQANYDSRDIYGRPDPIMSYKNTKRTINMNWVAQTHHNPFLLGAIRTLQRLLYASYAKVGSNFIIKDAPLFHITFGSANFGTDGQTANNFKAGDYLKIKKVFGVFESFDVQLYEGKVMTDAQGNYIPDRVGIQTTFTVLHHYFPGFKASEAFIKDTPLHEAFGVAAPQAMQDAALQSQTGQDVFGNEGGEQLDIYFGQTPADVFDDSGVGAIVANVTATDAIGALTPE